MTLLDEARKALVSRPDTEVIDLTEHRRPHDDAADPDPRHQPDHEPERLQPEPDRDDVTWVGHHRIEPNGRIPYRGMRIRRVRLRSLAQIALIFWLLAFAVLLGTVVVVWNVAHAFGFIESFEETMVTALGLEAFEIDGGQGFRLVAATLAVVCGLGWLGTVAMAAVYNAACGVFGGLAVETGPVQRRRRVFSWRHRGFVTVSE